MTAARQDAAVGGLECDPFAVDRERALEALRLKRGDTYDIGIVTISDNLGTIPLWVAIRLEGRKPPPLIGFTAEALEAALRDDSGEAP